jgi:hypothetical protein
MPPDRDKVSLPPLLVRGSPVDRRDVVPLDEGWNAPRRLLARFVDQDHNVTGRLDVVLGEHAEARITELTLWPATYPEGGFTVEQIRAIPWPTIMREALADAAWQTMGPRGVWAMHDRVDRGERPLPDGVTVEDAKAEARTSVRRVQRRRITTDDLRNLLEVHARGGIPAVKRDLGYSERHARRLLARARAEFS